jgi:hypothetical protein
LLQKVDAFPHTPRLGRETANWNTVSNSKFFFWTRQKLFHFRQGRIIWMRQEFRGFCPQKLVDNQEGGVWTKPATPTNRIKQTSLWEKDGVLKIRSKIDITERQQSFCFRQWTLTI